MRSHVYSKLITINENGNYKFSSTSENYKELSKYFPQVNLKHIAEIENFHKKVSAIFKQELKGERKKLLSTIEEYNAPLIHFTDSGYLFTTPDDTGTGIAYKGLVVFDLAILHLTRLPIIVHDSVVLKQISDDAIENIMNQYAICGKQTIIAFDKQQSYSEKTSELLEKYSVLKLAPNGQELFGRSWGKH